ncbi:MULTISPECIES: TolC family protein [Bacteroidota]|uniref:TolC family protein n=1 Tax=Flectobacillus rivi TaxID=2984209 RepID=A0ABT6Z8E2_9BACT|nr:MULTISPECIES: TolC family protein [Bacteroidota]MDI9877386.1 TolC family protein [Flectobacillus rivi]NBB26936.1 efflux transporter outer membrane subunit [Cellulophaga sp. BC115SP]
MNNIRKINYLATGCVLMMVAACVPKSLVPVTKTENRNTPATYNGGTSDSTNVAKIKWKEFFTDPKLEALIDTALLNNQELNLTLQEIEISRNEINARKGEYLPFVKLGGGLGVDKVSRYTSQGAADDMSEIRPGVRTPEVLPDMMVGARASWEVDIWHKLRNAQKVAAQNYFASIEGKNFLVTNLVGEIANSYYELLALDNQLAIIKQNIEILNNALNIIRQEKQAAKVTELAVRRFEAEVFKTQSLQYEIQQKIVEAENKINFLVGRYPQHVDRSSDNFNTLAPTKIYAGLPSQLIINRPDVRAAELKLSAAKLDVSIARANFYPSLGLSAGLGFRSYNPLYLVNLPQALITSLAGDIAGPLVNKYALIAGYNTASAKQIKAIIEFERTVLNACIEVTNQLSNIDNLDKNFNMKANQVDALTQSTEISIKLFKSARADYMEVLLTQRDVLESRMELIETKMRQMNAFVNAYRALGGGWN